MKAATAPVSLASAYVLWPTIPTAPALPGLSGLRKANEEMAEAVSDREALVAARTAELTDAYTEQEAFAYSVAHDLRTPLRSIDGFSDALAEEHATASMHPANKRSSASSERLCAWASSSTICSTCGG